VTRGPTQAHAVYRILDTGELTGRHRAHLSYHGPPEAAIDLVRELRSMRPASQADVLMQCPTQTTVDLETPLHTVDPGLACVAPTLAAHDMTPLLDPIVARDGRLCLRLVVTREVDGQSLLRALKDVQRAGGFTEFRIQRITSVAPAAHVDSTRRALAPEQEAMLALAASMGYYETPKVVTLDDISRAVGLSISPVHKRLKSAEEAIVCHHVGEEPPDARRRRARVASASVDAASPWEFVMRVRGDVGPALALAPFPGARASLHPLAADEASLAAVLVVHAPEAAQEAVLASLGQDAGVGSVIVLDRSSQHLALRLRLGGRGRHTLASFSTTWGRDASLRSVGYDQGEAHVRALLLRPHATDRLKQRIEECARASGWTDWDVVSLRSLGGEAPPPAWPEPLTQRQLEVLRVAHALGYYRTPRTCTLEHVAGTLGVSANAIHKNLVHAESKLISAYLASGI
jgi:predicted DNA binding protein